MTRVKIRAQMESGLWPFTDPHNPTAAQVLIFALVNSPKKQNEPDLMPMSRIEAIING